MTELDRLASLDPMRGFEPTPERRARADARLEQLIREPVARERSRPVRRLVPAGAALAALVVAGSTFLPGTPDEANAAWSPIPTEAPAVDVLPLALKCAAGWGPDWVTPPKAGDIVLAERRGIATLLLVAKDVGHLVSCTVLDPAEPIADGAMLIDRDPQAAPAADRVSFVSRSASGDGAGWYSEMIGRAGAEVEKIEILLPTGTVVRASIRDGWWAAWWPGHEAGEVGTARVRVHTPGRTETVVP